MADTLSAPGLWVIGSISLYLIAVFAGWRLLTTSRPRLVALRRRWQGWPFAPLIATGVRFLYYFGIPYLALLQGSIDLRTLGLIGADLPAALLAGAGAGLAAWAVMAQAWSRLLPPSRAGTASRAEPPVPGQAWSVPLDALYSQSHWALYRSWPILLWGTYVGVFAGLGLAAAEWLAGMLLGRGWLHADGLAWERGLTHLGLALVTSLVFLAGNSLWVCLLVHAGLTWALRRYLQPATGPSTGLADTAR